MIREEYKPLDDKPIDADLVDEKGEDGSEAAIFEFATHDIDLDASIAKIASEAFPVRYARSIERLVEEENRRLSSAPKVPDDVTLPRWLRRLFGM